MKEDIDKLKQTIEDGLIIFQDIEKALADDNKIDIVEGSTLVIKHGGKALRFISSLRELGEEIIDIDGVELSSLVSKLLERFGGSKEIKEALNDIALGSGILNQGIQKMIAIKKK